VPGSYVAVSAIGRDRIGLADDIAAWIEESGGNVEESKMAVLGGDFAVIMLVSGNDSTVESLVSGARARGESLEIALEAKRTAAPTRSAGGMPYTVETVSLDSPGIVHAVTREIRSMGISIEDLETSSSSAPWTGAPVFRMKATIVLPEGENVTDFRERMDELAHRRNLDMRLDPV
jgi:glycine cleavage system transcriptional repressor